MHDLPLVNKQEILNDLLPNEYTNMEDPANKGLASLIDLYLNDGPYYVYDPENSLGADCANDVNVAQEAINNTVVNVKFTKLATMCFADQPAPDQPKWWHNHAVHIHENPSHSVVRLDFNGCSAHSAFPIYFIKEHN